MAIPSNGETPRVRGNESDEVRQRLDAIEGELVAGLTGDRFSSGVPLSQRGTDLEFIQMTGLTRMSGATGFAEALQPAPPKEDLDAHEPISFYERGVADVDHAAGPPALEPEIYPPAPVREGPRAPAEPAVEPAQHSTADALRDLIADLTRDVDEPPAPLDEPPAPEHAGPDIVPAGISQSMESDWSPAPQEAGPWPVEAQPESPAFSETQPEPEPRFALEPEPEPLKPLVSEPCPYEPAGGGEWTPEAEEIVTPPASSHDDLDQRLAEAEELLQALEQQPHEAPEPVAECAPVPLHVELEAPVRPAPATQTALEPAFTDDTEAEPSEFADYPDITRSHRSSRRSYRRRRRRLLRMAALFAVLLFLGGVSLYVGMNYLLPRVQSADELAREADRFIVAGEYAAGVERLELLLNRFPDYPGRADVQFQEAMAHYMMKPSGSDAIREEAAKALASFEAFRKEHPGHPKGVRAESLSGILYYVLGQYDQAVAVLRPFCDPKRRGEDPEAVLPAMRTLARAYARLGDYQAAQETYEDSASLPRNFTQEVDYFELGSLFRERADATASPEERDALLKRAAECWENAQQAPGVDPQERERIRGQLEALRQRMGVPTETQKATPAAEDIASAARPPEEAETKNEAQAVVVPEPSVDPVAEARQLEAQAAPTQ